MNRYCDKCKFCDRVKDEDDLMRCCDWDESYTVHCMHPSFDPSRFIHGKVIMYYAYANENVQKPTWCPLKSDDTVDFNVKKPNEIKDLLRNVEGEGFTEWDDIKVGKVYHLPRILETERMDLLIKDKTNYSLTCKNVKEKNSLTKMLYKYDGTYKLLKKNELIPTLIKS